ncbi:MAG: hypothetical protein R6U32_00670 [Candidatus Woesearchaeota archaeon]
MITDFTLLQEIGIAALAVTAVLLLRKLWGKRDDEFERMYNEILTSDKYKVKGRFEE